MQRRSINPVTWSTQLGFNQGELVEGGGRLLYCSGQTSVGDDGAPLHDGDMAAQVARTLDNLEGVLRAADMTLANLVRLNVYTTDVDSLLANYGAVAARLGAGGASIAMTMVQVVRLAIPGQLIELEGTAVA